MIIRLAVDRIESSLSHNFANNCIESVFRVVCMQIGWLLLGDQSEDFFWKLNKRFISDDKSDPFIPEILRLVINPKTYRPNHFNVSKFSKARETATTITVKR